MNLNRDLLIEVIDYAKEERFSEIVFGIAPEYKTEDSLEAEIVILNVAKKTICFYTNPGKNSSQISSYYIDKNLESRFEELYRFFKVHKFRVNISPANLLIKEVYFDYEDEYFLPELIIKILKFYNISDWSHYFR